MPKKNSISLDLNLQFGDFPGLAAHKALLRKPRVQRWMQMALQGRDRP